MVTILNVVPNNQTQDGHQRHLKENKICCFRVNLRNVESRIYSTLHEGLDGGGGSGIVYSLKI